MERIQRSDPVQPDYPVSMRIRNLAKFLTIWTVRIILYNNIQIIICTYNFYTTQVTSDAVFLPKFRICE